MATIRTKPTGSKAIQVVMSDGARRAFGIGKVSAKAAGSSLPLPTALPVLLL